MGDRVALGKRIGVVEGVNVGDVVALANLVDVAAFVGVGEGQLIVRLQLRQPGGVATTAVGVVVMLGS